MTTLDPRTPIVVGGGQLSQHDETDREPARLLADAVLLAAEDAGAPALAVAADSIRVVGLLSWRYADPGRTVADFLGASPRHTVLTGSGGSYPQLLVNDAAEDIAAGRCDVVVVGGAETWRTRTKQLQRNENPTTWTPQPDQPGVLSPGHPEVPMWAPDEMAIGLDRPVFVYPLFEQALRIAEGRTIAEHRAVISELWSRFSEVAAGNPHAWIRSAHSAEEIATPTAQNRPVCAPYTKLLTSNNAVDQSAAVIVCSVEAARRHGVPEDRWVFLHAGSEAHDTGPVSQRPDLGGSPAIRAAGQAVLDLAGVTVDELGSIDLYSCFPVAVEVAAKELGLPLDRQLTVTGGLTFAGGPWNNYSTHAIAATLQAVRGQEKPALVTANSGYLTKHAMGIYATRPAAQGFRRAATPPPQPHASVSGYDGAATLEAWSVSYDRDGTPERAFAALRTPDGARTLAYSTEPGLTKALTAQELEGSAARVRADATFDLQP